MKWQNLYSAVRTGLENKSVDLNDNMRNSFLRDYDRIVFSSAFRRLQNKTQVFPLPGAVLVHNRLTHSLEVASVGRSLGKAVGDMIAEKHQHGENFTEFYRYELPSVIAAACLAHDIGNPPFGHSGEDAIRAFFREADGDFRKRFETELSENQQKDFLFFEGNANAFRILTHHFNEQLEGGYRLTYTTLASIVKYPCDSVNGFDKSLLVTKKSGFFDAEIETYSRIASQLEIPKSDPQKNIYARHPFVYLVEAADDICYRIIDFEDAHRLGIISAEKIKELFLAFFTGEQKTKIEDRYNSIVDANQKVQYLRAIVINHLIQRISGIFMQYENELLQGTLQKPLIDYLPDAEIEIVKKIDDFSVKHIYNHRSVVEIEIAGYNVIGGLLKEFYTALMNPASSKSKKILQLISRQFPVKTEKNSFYNDLQSIVDFTAGMTDLYAVEMYRNIKGISFPQIK